MDRKKAIEWMAREIYFLKLAPKVNGCEMTEEWAEQIQIYELAIDALSREEAEEKNVERTTKCSGIRCVMQSGTVDPENCPVENCPNFTPQKKTADEMFREINWVRVQTAGYKEEALYSNIYGPHWYFMNIHKNGEITKTDKDYLTTKIADAAEVRALCRLLDEMEGRK